MKIQSNRKLLTAFIASLVLSGLFYANTYHCYAAEGTSSGTAVTFTKTETDRYLLSVRAEGNGSIYDGEESIRGQISKYSLEVGIYKAFQIVPDKGYRLTRVLLNGTDITDQVSNGKIMILGTDYEQDLVFYFGKTVNTDDPNGAKDPNDKGSSDSSNSQGHTASSGVQTGDSTRIGGLLFCVISSLAILCIAMKRRKEEKSDTVGKVK